jgi:hypothetical protein
MRTPAEIGAKMKELGLWEDVMSGNWAIRPTGTVFPYFCTVIRGDGKIVDYRFLMLEGWQTFHDYLRTNIDHSFGFYSTPMEMPHYELVFATDGVIAAFRHDPGFVPRALSDNEKIITEKILWESYGVMLRLESERNLLMKFADEKAMFSRVENSKGEWADAPLSIPPPPPHIEKIAFPKETVRQAKDIQFDKDYSLSVDFRLDVSRMTKEARPRYAYVLAVVDVLAGKAVCETHSVTSEMPLSALWQSIPSRFLDILVKNGKIPGVIKVCSPRVFRILRPLCIELPIKLSLNDTLPEIETIFTNKGVQI